MGHFQERVLFDEILASHLAYEVGGPADALVFPRDEAELVWLAAFCDQTSLPLTIIGNGTNLLVRDGGIRGLTVSLRKAFREIQALTDTLTRKPVQVRCGGGVEKPELLEWAAARALSGLEFSSGVPGTIGGGIFMNAGTKYGCYGDILRKLRLFSRERGVFELKREDVHFGYRHQTAVQDSIVLSADFELSPGNETEIRSTVSRIIAERAEKQPLELPSCGSTFKNPEGLSAGRLIERSGLKGLRVGAAEVSTKHANFILNRGGAKASDILALIDTIKEKIRKEFQVELECEVIILGEDIPGS